MFLFRLFFSLHTGVHTGATIVITRRLISNYNIIMTADMQRSRCGSRVLGKKKKNRKSMQIIPYTVHLGMFSNIYHYFGRMRRSTHHVFRCRYSNDTLKYFLNIFCTTVPNYIPCEFIGFVFFY